MLTVAVVFHASCEAERSKKHNDVVSFLCHLICLINPPNVFEFWNSHNSQQVFKHQDSFKIIEPRNRWWLRSTFVRS